MNSESARRNLLIAFIACVVVFWLAVALVTTTGMRAWERNLFDVFYNRPSSWQPVMVLLTQAGGGLMVAAVCVVLFLKRQRLAAVRLILLTSATYIVAFIIKELVARPRANLLLNISQRGPHEAGYGFPSAHAAVVTAVAVALLPVVPRKWWWLLAVAIAIVGATRLYLGVHSPLDVIGGVAVGGAVSFGYLWFINLRAAKTPPKQLKNKTV